MTTADWTEGTPRLLIESCPACGHCWYLRRPACPRCGGDEVRPVSPAGTGRVLAVTVVHRAPASGHPPTPYGICLVDLDEKVRVMCRCEVDLAVGAPVLVAVHNVPWATPTG